jgi:hypothetical protein
LRYLVLAALAALSVPVAAQSVPPLEDIRFLDGNCIGDSHIAHGLAGRELTSGDGFRCDAAVLTYYESNGRFSITFSDRRGSGRPLSFAGVLQDRETLIVDRIHFGRAAIKADKGHCTLILTNRIVSSIVCGGQVTYDGQKHVPVIGFEVAK